MLSSNVVGAFALFTAAANAGPCRPTTTLPGTSIEATSIATLIDSTIELSSTVVESATETKTTDVPTTTAVVQESASTTAAEEPTTTIIVESSTTTEGLSTTTTAAEPVGLSCTTDDDCITHIETCVVGFVNICSCIDAVCTPAAVIEASTTTEASSTATTAAAGHEGLSCSTSDDCTSDADMCLDGLLNVCICLNAVCIRADIID